MSKGEPMPNHPDAYYAGYRAALDNDHAMTTKTVPDPIPNNPFEVPVNITAETATVYRTPNGRRYLTKKGAYLAMAKRRINQNCECQPAEHEVGYYGECCKYHDPATSYGERVMKRLTRHLAYNDRSR